MTFQHHDGSAGDPRLFDLNLIFGNASGLENLRTLARVRRDFAAGKVEMLVDAPDAIDSDADLEPWLSSGNTSSLSGQFTFGQGRIRIGMAREVWFATGLKQSPNISGGPRQLALFPHEIQPQGGR